MPADLTLRLLCAARQAYGVAGDGPVAPRGTGAAAPASGAIGWTGAPAGVRVGAFNQDAGLVGSIAEGTLVAFRGTTPPDFSQDPRQMIVDWAADAVAALAAPGGAPPGFPGKVHFGFYAAFMRLWDKLWPATRAAVQASAGWPVFVTGHSKGGALAALAGWRLRQDFPGRPVVVRTFAAPRVGDGAFAAAYGASGIDHGRYEFDDDIVPHLPMETALAAALGAPPLAAILLTTIDPGYGAVGPLGYIRADGSIVGDAAGLAADRVDRLIARLATADGPAYIAACHGIDASADGYVRASYPE